jgi:hypothetical protein
MYTLITPIRSSSVIRTRWFTSPSSWVRMLRRREHERGEYNHGETHGIC